MYGVDKFTQVNSSVERILSIASLQNRAAKIHLAFRTSNPEFRAQYKTQLEEYIKRGAFISHLWQYENYTGVIESSTDNSIVVKIGKNKIAPCAYACISMCVCWDGRVAACGCADFEGELQIGNVTTDPLISVWSGEKRKYLLRTFSNCKQQQVRTCRECSAYQPDSIFAYPYFSKIEAHKGCESYLW